MEAGSAPKMRPELRAGSAGDTRLTKIWSDVQRVSWLWCRWSDCLPEDKLWKGPSWLRAPRRHWRRCAIPAADHPAQEMRCLPRSWNMNPWRFQLDEQKFATNLRKSSRGPAASPSGMTTDHLRPVLGNPRDTHLFFKIGEQLAQGHTPQGVNDTIR